MEQNNGGTQDALHQTVPPHCYRSRSPSSGLNEQRSSSAPAAVLSLPTGSQTTSSANELQNTSPPDELNYSALNGRPPGNANINHAYEHDSTYDVKYINPPSYEEAIKAMSYVPPEDTDRARFHHYPDQIQVSSSEPYYYQQTCDNDLQIELAKSFCSRIVFAVIIFGFAICAIRIFYYAT